jgi:hypothetical protein
VVNLPQKCGSALWLSNHKLGLPARRHIVAQPITPGF